MAKMGMYQDQRAREQEALVFQFSPLVKRIAHHGVHRDAYLAASQNGLRVINIANPARQ